MAAALAVLSVLPLWRILPQRSTGLAGLATAELAASYTSLVWSGVLLALIPAVIAAVVFDSDGLEAGLTHIVSPLARPGALSFAFASAILATVIAGWVAIAMMYGKPTLIDGFAQLTQARYFANGDLAGPDVNAAWHIQQTIATNAGWVSQYPPGYSALLAAGFAAGGVALVGPAMFGVAILFTSLIAHEVFENVLLARVAALLAAVSSFMIGLSGAYMSHVPAAAFVCAAIWFVLRARDGSMAWSAAAGAAIGAAFAIRPLTGVVIGMVALAFGLTRPLAVRTKVTGAAAAIGAALPFMLAVATYNARFFGSPTTFGYLVSLGPGGGLGFGTDPWGNTYGWAEAFAYTSAELIALSVHLLETPIPLIALIGLYFALPSPSPSRLVFWACAALVTANLFYWHHGIFMGPRMLADTGPLWVLLAVLAVHGLIIRIRHDWLIADKYSVRVFALGGLVASLIFGLVYLTPSRLYSYRVPAEVRPLVRAPVAQRPELVFVHGGWSSRVAMRLAASGMRLDSVETAMRQNSTCKVHHYSLAFARGENAGGLEFIPRADRTIRAVEISPGNRIRVTPSEAMDAGCAREIAADTAGVLDATPYIWQGDLPGISNGRSMFVRDMGPEENVVVLAKFHDREPRVALMTAHGISIVGYETGMKTRWGSR